MPATNILRTFPPHPSVSDYISSIVVIENGDPQFDLVLPLIANGYPGIVFQTTDSGLRSNGDDKLDNLFLYGQFVKPVELYTKGRLTFIAYFFHPHVLKNVTGTDGKELTDRCIDLHFFRPAKKEDLKEQLLNATSLKMRLSILDKFVLQLAGQHRLSANKNILFATQAIRNSTGLISLKNIRAELHITERTFQRLFEFHVGLSPKMFSRICQFHSAFQQVNRSQNPRLSDIAYEMGYSDQSHFIRSFKEFTHYSPGEYWKMAREFQDRSRKPADYLLH